MSERYKTLIGSLLSLLILGSVYAWSLFNMPLAKKLDVSVGEVALTFGLLSLALAAGASISGQLKNKIGIKNVVILAAFFVGIGLAIAAFSTNTIELYISAGLLLGLGDGLGYMLILTNCVRFFPNNKGLVSALSIGAYGGGSLVFKVIDANLIQVYGLEITLLVWSIIATTLTALSAMLIYDSIKMLDSGQLPVKSLRDMTLAQSVRTKEYWILAAMFLIDCMCGLYVIGVASNIATAMLNLSYQDAATAVTVVALSNILGRLVIGVLSDKLPRLSLITFDQIITVIALLLLLFMVKDSKFILYASLGLIAFSFGGTLTLYPSIVSDFFGLRNFTKNYGLLYLGFGIGSLLGSIIGAILNSFVLTFIVILALAILATVLSLIIRLPKELRMGHKELKDAKLLHRYTWMHFGHHAKPQVQSQEAKVNLNIYNLK